MHSKACLRDSHGNVRAYSHPRRHMQLGLVRTVEEDVHAVVVCQVLQRDAHLLKLLRTHQPRL